ncbi:hypothetical protein GJ629_13365 [Halapricum sp. CBA1109]|uniref:DUF7093 family protein n=1 Tax=Halapricum sp. CBA1109 TaxID=2668068 RepID=UPI0012F7E951|nr:hypothetical protein [Halapricum sp. CBA1109]MUV90766.1 hypothetical protein [Halapricum sp. CBA1109]
MGIKCSLLGHSFDDGTVEREREEQGSEVVITIRETETCTRCGQERVVSENKEVTTLETPDDVGAEPTPPEPDPEPDPVPEAESTDDKTVPTVEEPTEETTEEPPVTDDAEILDDDEEDDTDREPGQWPQEADPDTAEDEDFDQYGYVEDDPEDAAVVEGDDAEFIDDDGDAEFIDDGDDEPAEQSAARTNAWPSEQEGADENGQPTGPGAVTVPDGEFVCGNCGFSTPVESSSLRAGDFCPECHKETLEQVRE